MQFSQERDRIALRGNLTEADDLRALASALAGEVVLDLSGLQRINSSGVREWVNFVRGLGAGVRLVLEKCPINFVMQMNMIVNFVGGAEVRSVAVPYFCPTCQSSSEVFVETALLRAGPPAPPRCAGCGGGMELDAVEDEYFAFLKGVR